MTRDAGTRATRRSCAWCEGPIPQRARIDSLYCHQRCRQAAARARGYASLGARADRSLRLAIADPPYPGFAHLYRGQASYDGEVDHVELIAELQSYDGWLLCTSSKTLRQVIALCPPDVQVGAWGKTRPGFHRTRGVDCRLEHVLYRPARELPGAPVVDWISASSARGGGHSLIGRKPRRVAAWHLQLLGARSGDRLWDAYPGTGTVGAVASAAGLELVKGPTSLVSGLSQNKLSQQLGLQ